MTKKEKYTYSVQQCIAEINKRVSGLDLNRKNSKFKLRKISITACKESRKFNLKFEHVLTIYLGKSNLKYKLW